MLLVERRNVSERLLEINNKTEAKKVLKEIFKNLRKAEKLSKTRELTGAIQGDLKTYALLPR